MILKDHYAKKREVDNSILFYWDVERFKNRIHVGDRIRLFTGNGGNVGMEADKKFSDWMTFTVTAKYPCVVQLEHTTRKHRHIFTPSYKRLYMMIRS